MINSLNQFTFKALANSKNFWRLKQRQHLIEEERNLENFVCVCVCVHKGGGLGVVERERCVKLMDTAGYLVRELESMSFLTTS